LESSSDALCAWSDSALFYSERYMERRKRQLAAACHEPRRLPTRKESAMTMTRRELVEAAIAHQTTPRVPYLIDLCRESWEKLAPTAGGRTCEQYLDNDVQDIAVPWWQWHNLAQDWTGVEVPTSRATVLGYGTYENLADNINRLREHNDKYFLVRIYGSHFEKAQFARGFENLMADIAGDYAFAKRLHRQIIDRNLVMLENFLSIGEIDGVLLGSDWGSQRGPLIAPQVWDDLIRPGEQAEYDLIHAYGKDVWVHSCGDVQVLIPRLIEMGLDVLNPVQPECMDLAELKRRFGARLTFWGGISTQNVLPFGSPQEVRDEARRVRDLMADGGGYIFAPSQSIQDDVPVSNVEALLSVAREGR
jgi:uroporphyrinogen decarboxylase